MKPGPQKKDAHAPLTLRAMNEYDISFPSGERFKILMEPQLYRLLTLHSRATLKASLATTGRKMENGSGWLVM